MKRFRYNHIHIYVLSVLVVFVSVVFFSQFANAAINEEINYQAKLTDTAGSAVSNGDYEITYKLYTVPTGGGAIFTEVATSTVTNGLFSYLIGSSTSLSGVDFNQTLYLGVEIESDGEMTPRKRLGAVPAAFEANNAETFAGIATTSFLRSDIADIASSLLTFTSGLISQSSSTISELTTSTTTVTTFVIDGEEFTSISGGSSGLTNNGGTLTANISESNLNVAAAPTNGYVLQASSTSAGGFVWQATSSLGFSDTDTTLTVGTDNQIPFSNAGGTDFDYSSLFTFDGTNLNLGAINGLAFGGTRYLYASSTNDSIAFGENAGATFNSLTTYNVALGFGAGRYSSTTFGDYNNFMGYQAGYNNTGTSNNILGHSTGYNNSGSFNSLLGLESGYNNTGASNNMLGYSTGYNNTGAYNNLLGDNAGYNNTGSDNNMLGYSTGYNNTGSFNNLLGDNAGYNNTGSYSEFIGFGAGARMSASSTVVIGSLALRGGGGNPWDGNAATTTNNTVIGYGAGYNVLTGGDNNLLLGYQAADSLTTGASNIIIGYDVEAPSNTGDNQLNIGNLIFGTGIDGVGTTLSAGGIAIGTTTGANARLSVQSQGTTDILNLFETGGTEVFTVLESGNTSVAGNDLIDVDDISFNGGANDLSYLRIPNKGATDRLDIFDDDGTGAIISFADSGNVGIGTTNPGSKLDVAGDIEISGDYSFLANTEGIEFLKHTNNSANFWVWEEAADQWGYFVGNDNTEIQNLGGILDDSGLATFLTYDGTWGGSNGWDISSLTGTGALAATIAFDHSDGDAYFAGNIGIGTTSPASTLDVWGDFRVGTSSTPTLFTDVSTGRVGIGTLAPTEKLHVYDGNNTFRFHDGAAGLTPYLELSGAGVKSVALLTGTNGSAFTFDETGHFSITKDSSANITGGASDQGTELLRVTSDGEMGIGTTSPASKLDVWGDFRVGTSGTPVLYADTSTERVGVGTVSPATTLHLMNENAASNGPVLRLSGRPANGGQYHGYIQFWNDDINQEMASIVARRSGNGESGADLEFWTQADPSQDLLQRMVIDDDGLVGIGTSSPTELLSVAGGDMVISDSNAVLTLDSTAGQARDLVLTADGTDATIMHGGGNLNLGSNNEDIIYISPSSDNSVLFNARVAVGTTTMATADIPAALFVQTFSTLDILNLFETGGTEVFTVLESGNVGIGSSTPSYDLSVVGDTVITGALRDNSYSAGTNGMVLQTTGSGFAWVATSSLGLGGSSGTVTSVDMSVPTGLAISGNPITDSGTLALTYDTGYTGVLTASTTEWDTAYGWGDHSVAGYQSNALTNGYVFRGGSGNTAEATSTLFINDSGNVGIGTTSPASTLDVWGDFRVGTSSTPSLFVDTSYNQVILGSTTPYTGGDAALYLPDNGRIVFEDNDSGRVSYILNNPTGYLNVVSDIYQDYSIGGTNNDNDVMRLSSSGVIVNMSNQTDKDFLARGGTDANLLSVDASTDRVGIGTSSPASKLDVWGDFRVGTSSTPTLFVDTGIGRVGIGTTTLNGPTTLNAQLVIEDVENIWASSTGIYTNIAKNGNNNAIFGGNFNAAQIGTGAGNQVRGINAYAEGRSSPFGAYIESLGINSALEAYGLYVTASGATENFGVYASADKNYFSGDVGIGTSSPSYKLSVVGDAVITGALRDNSYSAGTNGMVLQTTGSGFAWVATSSLGFTDTDTTLTVGTDNQIPFSNGGGTDFDYSSNFTFDGSLLTVTGDIFPGTNLTYDLGSSSNRFANVWAETLNVGTSTWSIFNGDNGRLAFSSAAEQGGTEALSILTSGNVGIGTTSPSADLHIFDDAAGASILLEAPTNFDSKISFAEQDTIYWQLGNDGGTNSFRIGSSFSDSGTDFIIDSSGNIGIGTTSPYAKLSISQTGGGTDPLFAIASSTNGAGTSTALFVNANGQVIVGADQTTSEAFLVVQGDTWSSDQNLFEVKKDSTSVFSVDEDGDISTVGTEFKFTNNSRLTIRGVRSGSGPEQDYMQFKTGNVTEIHFRNGYIGVGTTSPDTRLHIGSSTPNAITAGEQYNSAFIAGSLEIDGTLYDNANSAGTNGMVLQTTGSGFAWVATSSLGLGGGGSGTVTSVDMSVPTGLAISGNPITDSGTLALTYDTGYTGVLTASTTNWNTFYDTPSTVITAGDGIEWSTNTLNVNDVSASMLVSGDFGDFSCNGTTCSFDTTTVASSTLNIANWTNGYVMQASTTATGGFDWVATSTLGLGGGSSLTVGSDNEIPFSNTSGTDFEYDSGFTFDGTTFTANQINLSDTTQGYEIGGNRMFYATSSSGNGLVAIGYNAGAANPGVRSVAIGYGALDVATSDATQNVAVGYSALGALTSGDGNVAIGYNALVNNETGSTNFAMGDQSLRDNVSGSSNISIGSQTMLNVESSNNIGIGNSALANAITGTYNVGLGEETLMRSNATNSVAIGYQAGRGAVSGDFQDVVLLGYNAGFSLDSGADNNILIGYQAGNALTTGANNIVIGYDVDLPSNTGSNQMTIGNLIFGTGIDGVGTTLSAGGIAIGTTTGANARFSVQSQGTTDILSLFETGGNEVFTVLESGNIGIGLTTPSTKLDVLGTASSSDLVVDNTVQLLNITGGILAVDGSGNVSASTSIAASGIEDAYVLNTGDTMTGALTMSGANIILNNNWLSGDGGNEGIFINSSGDVGIGTANPDQILTIGDGTTTGGKGIHIEDHGDAFIFLEADEDNVSEGDNAYIKLSQDNGAVSGIFGLVGANGTDPEAVVYTGTLDNALLLGGTGSLENLQFGTNDTVRMTIDTSGNVGIGTTSPQALLDISADNAEGTLSLSRADATLFGDNNLGLINFTGMDVSTGRGLQTYASIAGVAIDDNGVAGTIGGAANEGGGIAFSTGIDTTGSTNLVLTERMRIDANGNVGIGTTTPATALHIDSNSNSQSLRIVGAAAGSEIADIYVDSGGALVLSTLNGSDSGGFIDLFTEDDQFGLVLRESDGTGIGSTYANFYVTDAVDDYLAITVSSATDGDALVVTQSDRVGIGTTSPSNILHVYSDDYTLLQRDTTISNSSRAALVLDRLHSGGAGADGIGSSLAFRAETETEGTVENVGIMGFVTTDATAGTVDGEFFVQTYKDGVGVSAMRIDADGNVGIGTTTPDGTLHVYTASAGNLTAHGNGNDLVVENDTSGGISILTPDANSSLVYFGSPSDTIGAQLNWNHDSDLFIIGTAKVGGEISLRSDGNAEALRIDSSGNVGIGTGTPATKLHVYDGDVDFEQSAGPGRLRLVNGTLTPAADTTLGNLAFRGRTSTGGYHNYASIFGVVTDDTDGAEEGHLRFNVSDGTGSVPEVMRIDSSGNVGIGTTSPSNLLHVSGGTAGAAGFILEADTDDNDEDDTPFLYLTQDGGVTAGYMGFVGQAGNSPDATAEAYADTLANALLLGTESNMPVQLGANSAVAMTIDTSGNVGIGTTSPSAMLTVGAADNFTVTSAGNVTTADLTTTGAFTSLGIDDNATSEMLQISDGTIVLGQSGSAATVRQFNNDQNITLSGGNASGAGANLIMYGGTHAAANDFLFRSGTTNLLRWDDSDSQWEFENGIYMNGTAANIALGTNYLSGDGGDEGIYIDSAGRIGIGTTTPAQLLDIYSAASQAYMGVDGNTQSGIQFRERDQAADNERWRMVAEGGLLYFQALTDAGAGGGNYVGFDRTSNTVNGLGFYQSAVLKNYISTGGDSYFTSGNVGIGTTTPAEKLHVLITAASGNILRLEDSDSTCNLDASGSGPSCGSDETLKKDVSVIIDELATIMSLEPSSYRWKTDATNTPLQHGFIAQDVEAVLPHLVTEGEWVDGTTRKFLSMSGLMPYAVGAIKEIGTVIDLSNASTTQTALTVTASGTIAIGTTTATAQLTTDGSVRFANFGAGTLQTDTLGNLMVSSDERLKDIDGDFTPGLDAVLGIEPIEYKWLEETGFDSEGTYIGFSAQNVELVLPDAVSYDNKGFRTLSDRTILAAVINAVQEIWAKLTETDDRVTELEAEVAELRALIGNGSTGSNTGNNSNTNDNSGNGNSSGDDNGNNGGDTGGGAGGNDSATSTDATASTTDPVTEEEDPAPVSEEETPETEGSEGSEEEEIVEEPIEEETSQEPAPEPEPEVVEDSEATDVASENEPEPVTEENTN